MNRLTDCQTALMRCICRGTIAATVTIALVSGCSDERDSLTPAPRGELSDTMQPTAADPDQVEDYSQEVQEPEPDHSIDDNASEAAAMAQFAMIESAVAEIKPTDGNQASGTVQFSPSQDQNKMQVTVRLSGLTPGLHGFHIHDNGDCSAPDASSAGPHFNPYNNTHGAPEGAQRHVGDLGNVDATEDGRVEMNFEIDGLAFSGPASILQKAVVVHAQADDLKTDPSGQSGAPVGCGVIYQQQKVLAPASSSVP